jgi:hypothetical protein
LSIFGHNKSVVVYVGFLAAPSTNGALVPEIDLNALSGLRLVVILFFYDGPDFISGIGLNDNDGGTIANGNSLAPSSRAATGTAGKQSC